VEIDNPVYKSAVEQYAKEHLQAEVKSASFEEGKVKFSVKGEVTEIPIEHIAAFAEAGQLGNKQHQEALVKSFTAGEKSLSNTEHRALLNLERLKYMKARARKEQFKKSGWNHDRPKGEFQVYSPNRKRNVMEGLFKAEDATKWIEKYQTVEPIESLVVLKNSIPVKEQPGIKEEKSLKNRVKPALGLNKGIRR